MSTASDRESSAFDERKSGAETAAREGRQSAEQQISADEQARRRAAIEALLALRDGKIKPDAVNVTYAFRAHMKRLALLAALIFLQCSASLLSSAARAEAGLHTPADGGAPVTAVAPARYEPAALPPRDARAPPVPPSFRASLMGTRALAASPPGAIFSDAIYGANPFSFHAHTLSDHPNEHYDTFTGSLNLLFTDVDLPGLAGFGIALHRVYSINQVYQSIQPMAGADSGLNATGAVLQFGQYTGLGWQMILGAICGDPLGGANNVQVVGAEQSVKQAIRTSPTLAEYALDDGSQLIGAMSLSGGGTGNCDTGPCRPSVFNGPLWVLERGDGITNVYTRPVGAAPGSCYVLVESRRGPGLALEVTYDVYGGVSIPRTINLLDGANLQWAPEVRFVVDTTDYQADTAAGLQSIPRLASILVGGTPVMTYTHRSFLSAQRRTYELLSTQVMNGAVAVEAPTVFTYQTASDPMEDALKTMTYPEGGSITYSTAFQLMTVPAQQRTTLQTFHPVLVSKTVQASAGAMPATWRYDKVQGTPFAGSVDKTTVTAPMSCGPVKQYTHVGYGLHQGATSCNTNADCASNGAGYTCVSRVCVGPTRCRTNADCRSTEYCATNVVATPACFPYGYGFWRMGTVQRVDTLDAVGGTVLESQTFDYEPSAAPLSAVVWETTPFGGAEPHYVTELHGTTRTRGALTWQTTYSDFDALSRWRIRTEIGDSPTGSGPGQARTMVVSYQDIRPTDDLALHLGLISSEATYPGTSVAGTPARTVTRSYRAAFWDGTGPGGSVIAETSDAVQRQYTFDPAFNPTTVVEPAPGGTTTVRTGNLGPGRTSRNVSTAAGVQRRYETDAFGNLSMSLLFTVGDGVGNGVAGWGTMLTHDVLGRLTQVTPPAGSPLAPTNIVYALDGTSRTATRASLVVTERFDGLGRRVANEEGAGTPDVRTTLAQYDACGQITSSSHPFFGSAADAQQQPGLAHWETQAYDKLGRRTVATHPDGTTVTMEYDRASRHASRRTDEVGNVVDTLYAAYGEPSAREIVEVDSGGSSVRYKYDVLGHTLQIARPGGSLDTYAFNANNFLTDETHPESGHTAYTPNALNQLATKIDAAGRTTTYTYDGDGRKTQIAYSGTTETINYDYHISPLDSGGRAQVMPFLYAAWRITPNNGTNTICRMYNPDGSVQSQGCGGGTNDVVYNISPEGYPLGFDLRQGFFPNFRPGVRLTYNAVGEPTGVQTRMNETSPYQAAIPSVTWHATGALHRLQFADGTTITEELQPERDYVHSLTAVGPSANSLVDLRYTRRGDLRLTDVTDTLNGAVGPTSRAKTFQYDALGRLMDAVGPWGDHRYAYLPSGDRHSVTRNGATSNYTYNDGTNLLTSVSGSVPRSFTYDPLGQIQTETRTSGASSQTVTYGYSVDGYLSSIMSGQPPTTRTITDGTMRGGWLSSTQANWTTNDVGATVSAPGRPTTTITDVSAQTRAAALLLGTRWPVGAIQPVTISPTTMPKDTYRLDPFGLPLQTDDQVRRWLHGVDDDLLLSQDYTSTRLYIRLKGQLFATKLVDESNQRAPVDLGNTNLISDPMGTSLAQVAPGGAVTHQESTPFGELATGGSWGSTTPAAYQNQLRKRGNAAFFTLGDPFDLSDTPGRMYSPSLGRYLSADPKLGAIGRVLGHDRYSHALNDPNMYVDPSGGEPRDLPESTYVSITREMLGFVPFIGPWLDLQDAIARESAAHDAYVNDTGPYSDYAKAWAAEGLAVGFLALDILTLGEAEGAVVFAKASGRAAAEHQASRFLRTPTTADRAALWRRQGGLDPHTRGILGKDAHLDHIQSFAKHGPADPGNPRQVQLLEPKTNWRKGTKDPKDFAWEERTGGTVYEKIIKE
jgi:RHS repeat-associated protein